MILTALILGFAGSLHCLGMCSPLMLAVTNLSPKALLARFVYNLGRIFTYGIMGGMVASVGLAFPLLRFQNLLSLLLGIALVTIGIAGMSAMKIPLITNLLAKLSFKLKDLFAQTLRKKQAGTTLLLGALNGLLPCGLTFLAFTYCLTLSGPLDGFNFMMMFGVGTLPVMLGITSILKWFISRLKFSIQKLTTALMIFSGVLLIARVFMIHVPASNSLHEAVVDIVICR